MTPLKALPAVAVIALVVGLVPAGQKDAPPARQRAPQQHVELLHEALISSPR